MSDTKNRFVEAFSCCPCGMFTVQPRQPLPEDKYRLDEEEHKVFNTDKFSMKHSIQLENPKERFRRQFYSAADSDGEVDAFQLKKALNGCFDEDLDFPFDGFSLDACRSMVALGDPDLSGQLRFQEAEALFNELWKWKNAFQRFDNDRNGYFHSHEFKDVLEAIGYRINETSVRSLVTRYSDRNNKVYFADFVSCMFKLTAMYELFRDKSNNSMDKAAFTTDEFIQLTLYS